MLDDVSLDVDGSGVNLSETRRRKRVDSFTSIILGVFMSLFGYIMLPESCKLFVSGAMPCELTASSGDVPAGMVVIGIALIAVALINLERPTKKDNVDQTEE